jgi:hypothetical protein
MDDANRKPGAHKPDKVRRLAEALRENLRKRKAQSRARRGGADVAGALTEDRRDGGEASDDTKTGNER